MKPDAQWKNIRLNEFTAPAPTLKGPFVSHVPPVEIPEGKDYTINITVAAETHPESVIVFAYTSWRPVQFKAERTAGYSYTAKVPGDAIRQGVLKYFIVIGDQSPVTYPGAVDGKPGNWDFDWTKGYSVNVVNPKSPVYIYNALTDDEYVSRNWAPGSQLVPLSEPGKGELQLRVKSLFEKDEENPQGDPVYDYSMRLCFKDKRDLTDAKQLVFRGRSLTGKESKVQVALISKTGEAYGATISLGTGVMDYIIPLSNLKKVNMVTLPRPYPSFLPYYFESPLNNAFSLSDIEVLQISIGPGLSESEVLEKQEIGIESVRVE